MPPSEPVTAGLLRTWALPDNTGTKDDRGRVLVVGGARETAGAVRLAGEAALRVGAGKLQLATVTSCAPALAVAVPEALVRGLPETGAGAIDPDRLDEVLDLVAAADTVLLGPGLVGPDEAAGLVAALMPAVTGRLVLDALAMAGVKEGSGQVTAGHGPAVLTPNVTELTISLGRRGSAGAPTDLADVAGAVDALVAQTGAVVVSGTEVSVIGAPDGRRWTDDSGPTGLGISGSGDVLAGVIAGLLARGAEPAQAAVWGSHLHGQAANRLAASIGPVGYLAREVVDALPAALRHIG